METQVANDPQVTIVVVPRERFNCARKCLETVYENTDIPFKLVYVDGAPPRYLRSYLEEQSKARGFQLVRCTKYVTPNQARNLGRAHVETPYVVFMDNDVMVSPGWLEALVECADETGAAIVNPLTCQGEPLHETLHFAGGRACIEEVENNGVIERHLFADHPDQERSLKKALPDMRRAPTEACEFHCVLTRMDVLDEIGPFDEELAMKENIDFSLTVLAMGGSVYMEPGAVVTFFDDRPMTWADVPYYMVRWSDSWMIASLERLKEKWNLTEGEFFQSRYRIMGWRRRRYLIRPFCAKLPLPRGKRRLEDLLVWGDRILNRVLVPRGSLRPKK